MRDSVKDRMKPKLAKDSFIVPPFDIARSSNDGVYRLGQAVPMKSNIDLYYENQVKEQGLTYNHYVSLKDQYTLAPSLES